MAICDQRTSFHLAKKRLLHTSSRIMGVSVKLAQERPAVEGWARAEIHSRAQQLTSHGSRRSMHRNDGRELNGNPPTSRSCFLPVITALFVLATRLTC